MIRRRGHGASRGRRLILGLACAALFACASSATAAADPTPKFQINASALLAPATVKVEDHTSNPDGYDLTYEWQREYRTGAIAPDVRAGSPECLNPGCSEAKWDYSSPGTYYIAMRVSWPGGSGYAVHAVTLRGPPPEVSAPITLVGPTERALPADFELLSPKTHMFIPEGGGCRTGAPGSYVFCDPYPLSRSGPDAGGLYHYLWRLPTAPLGEVTMEIQAWTTSLINGDRATVTLTATYGGTVFGEFQTCLEARRPTTPAGISIAALSYTSQEDSTAVVLQQRRAGRGWTKPALKAWKAFPVDDPEPSPYHRRELRVRAGEEDLARGRVRLLFFVVKGERDRPPERGKRRAFAHSTQPCLAPGGFA